MIDVNEGDVIQGGRVVKRYNGGLGVETAVIESKHHADKGRIINEMAQMGWTYHFTRESVGMMWFRESEEWNMEPGAGDS